jgi:PKD repeat protein
MVNKKYIAVTLVLFMLFASLSSVASARFRFLSESSKEINDTGRMHCLTITDTQEVAKEIWVINAEDVEPFIIPTEVKGYYPINQNKITSEFRKENLEVEFWGTRLFIISCIIDPTAWPVYRDHGYLPIWLKDIKAVDDPEPKIFQLTLDTDPLGYATEEMFRLDPPSLPSPYDDDYGKPVTDGELYAFYEAGTKVEITVLQQSIEKDGITYVFDHFSSEDEFDIKDEFVVVMLMDSNKALRACFLPQEEPDENDPPVANFSYVANLLDPLAIIFTDESSDPDGDELTYLWSFGDGSTSTEQNPTHKYAEAGLYDVSLDVADDDGETAGITKPVNVESGEDPVPPENGSITGRVVTIEIPNETPDGPIPVKFINISEANVNVYSTLDLRTVLYSSTTDGHGIFTITDVVPGGYLLNVTAGGYQPRLTYTYVVQGKTTHIPFIILMPER